MLKEVTWEINDDIRIRQRVMLYRILIKLIFMVNKKEAFDKKIIGFCNIPFAVTVFRSTEKYCGRAYGTDWNSF